MAKTYKPATERQIKRGKGVSTDELSFKEALKYFQARGKEKDMNRFRHKGKVYDLTGKEIAPKAAPKAKPATNAMETSPRPKARPATGGGGGDGDAEVKRRSADAKPTTSSRTGPTKTEKMRGDARTSAASTTKINNIKKRLRELQEELDNNSTALAVASLGSGVLTRGNTTARGTPHNPTFGNQTRQPTGPQGRMNTEVGRTARVGGGRGLPGIDPATTAKRLGRGGRMNTLQNRNDFGPFLN